MRTGLEASEKRGNQGEPERRLNLHSYLGQADPPGRGKLRWGLSVKGEANPEIEVAEANASQTSTCVQIARGLVKKQPLIPSVWVGPESLRL